MILRFALIKVALEHDADRGVVKEERDQCARG
jgi:hypothetical protein